jgi:hypothetical protein
MSEPGLFYVESRIINPSVLDASTFNTWYDTVHIPDILHTSGMKTAIRYRGVDKEQKYPFLACYPVQDISFLSSEEFKSIPHQSDMLPGPGHSCFDNAQFDSRVYSHVQTYEAAEASTGMSYFSAKYA